MIINFKRKGIRISRNKWEHSLSRHQKLATENAELRQRISDLSQQASSDHRRQLNEPHGTVLIGSSVIRDISDDKLAATRCICRRGGAIKDLQEALDNLPTNKPLSRIILIGGGNNCDSENDDLDVTGITAQYRYLVECAKSRATKVTICSVCPRIKSTTVSQRIESLNAGLKGIAGDLGVDYLHNDPIFHLQDGMLNDGYLLADGVHLTHPATNRLVAHMHMPLRQCENSAYSDHRRRASKQDPPGPTSEGDTDDGFNHPFSRKAHQKAKRQHQSTRRPHMAQHATESPVIGDTNARASQWSHKRNAFINAGPHIHPPPRHFEQLRPQARRQMAMPGLGGQQTPLSRTPPPPHLMDIASHPPIPSHTREPVQTRTYRDTPQVPVFHSVKPAHTPSSTQCQLCLVHGHSAVTCKSRDSKCYACSNYGHFARLMSIGIQTGTVVGWRGTLYTSWRAPSDIIAGHWNYHRPTRHAPPPSRDWEIYHSYLEWMWLRERYRWFV